MLASSYFNWFVRRLLLRGLPSATVTACLEHREVRALLRFRFAYLFAFHGPVLVPLLEALGGQSDPALSVLSLGVASVAMVLADVPTGLYADRRGPEAALRLGLRLTCLVLVAFFVLSLWRAWVLAHGHHGPWLPGIIGLLVLEAAIGVSLALLSGADTVLFLGVLRRANIAGLQSTGSEGVGSSVRYLGTMISVAFGAVLYDLSSWLVAAPALRLALQSGLFLLTLLSQLVALRELSRIAEVPPPAGAGQRRPGFRDVARGLAALTRFPGFALQMWLLCLLAAAALFAVYLFQSPLNRLTTELVRRSPLWAPVYVVTAVLGYWACSRGSRDAHRHHDRDALSLTEAGGTAPRYGVASRLMATGLGLLLLYPVIAALLQLGPQTPLALWLGRLGFVIAAAGNCLLFNYVRGFVEPYSAATLVTFTQSHALSVPASIISGFNSLKRGMHFVLSLLFYVVRSPVPSSAPLGPDRELARMLLYVTAGLLALALPAGLLVWAGRGVGGRVQGAGPGAAS